MIVVSEFLAAPGPEMLAASGQQVMADPALWRDRGRLLQALRESTALVVRNQTRVDAALLEVAPALRVIGRLGVGLDNIDLAAARARQITVTAARNANAISVAEYVLGALVHLARNFAGAHASVVAGRWEREAFTGDELWGKTLGLIGVGEIGRRVARRARAFGMTVVGYDPLLGPYDYPLAEEGIELLSFDEVLARAQAMSIHVPLIAATRHLFNERTLGLLRPEVVLINTSRGGVIDEAALARALDAGRLRAAVLDVREVEPPPDDDPLRLHPGVLLTPHVAGLTNESQERTSRLVVADVLRVLAGERAIGAV